MENIQQAKMAASSSPLTELSELSQLSQRSSPPQIPEVPSTAPLPQASAFFGEDEAEDTDESDDSGDSGDSGDTWGYDFFRPFDEELLAVLQNSEDRSFYLPFPGKYYLPHMMPGWRELIAECDAGTYPKPNIISAISGRQIDDLGDFLVRPCLDALRQSPDFRTPGAKIAWTASMRPTESTRWGIELALKQWQLETTFAPATAIMEKLPGSNGQVFRFYDESGNHALLPQRYTVFRGDVYLVAGGGTPPKWESDRTADGRRETSEDARVAMVIEYKPRLSCEDLEYFRDSREPIVLTTIPQDRQEAARRSARSSALKQLAYQMLASNAPMGVITNGCDAVVLERDFDYDMQQLQEVARGKVDLEAYLDTPTAAAQSPSEAAGPINTAGTTTTRQHTKPKQPTSTRSLLPVSIKLRSWSWGFRHPGYRKGPGEKKHWARLSPIWMWVLIGYYAGRKLAQRPDVLDDRVVDLVKEEAVDRDRERCLLNGGRCSCMLSDEEDSRTYPDGELRCGSADHGASSCDSDDDSDSYDPHFLGLQRRHWLETMVARLREDYDADSTLQQEPPQVLDRFTSGTEEALREATSSFAFDPEVEAALQDPRESTFWWDLYGRDTLWREFEHYPAGHLLPPQHPEDFRRWIQQHKQTREQFRQQRRKHENWRLFGCPEGLCDVLFKPRRKRTRNTG